MAYYTDISNAWHTIQIPVMYSKVQSSSYCNATVRGKQNLIMIARLRSYGTSNFGPTERTHTTSDEGLYC